MTQHGLSFLSRWGREPDSTSNSSATLMNSQSNQPDCTALIICNLQLMLHTTETFWCANLTWYGAQRKAAKDLWIPASFEREEIWDNQHAANFRTETALHRATGWCLSRYFMLSASNAVHAMLFKKTWALFAMEPKPRNYPFNRKCFWLLHRPLTFPCVEGNLL